MKLSLCHRIEVLRDRDGSWYAEVTDDSQTTIIHTTDCFATQSAAYDKAEKWDKKNKRFYRDGKPF